MSTCNIRSGECKEQQCEPESIFAGVADPTCSTMISPANMMGERFVYDQAIKDLINTKGMPVNYYINTFNVETADLLYGEEPLAKFYGPVPFMMYVELEEDALSLETYGWNPEDVVTAHVHIDTFSKTMLGTEYNVFTDNGYVLSGSKISDVIIFDKPHESNNQRVEPKAGDLIELTGLGCNRPGDRGAKIFEITEAVDQDVDSLNPVMGHYSWRLRGKRYDHSWEPGGPAMYDSRSPRECGDEQVYDNSFIGVLSGERPAGEPIYDDLGELIIDEDNGDYMTEETSLSAYKTDGKSYEWDIDVESKEEVYDMDNTDTSIYGQYY